MEPVIKNGVNYGALVVVNIDGILACVTQHRANLLGFDVTDIDPNSIDFNTNVHVCMAKGYVDAWLYTSTEDIRRLFNALVGSHKDWQLTVSGACRTLMKRSDSGEIAEKSYRDFYLVETDEDREEEVKYVF